MDADQRAENAEKQVGKVQLLLLAAFWYIKYFFASEKNIRGTKKNGCCSFHHPIKSQKIIAPMTSKRASSF